MRSYKQHCGLAKTLDVVGDRWTLLIVRELLIQGPCRYTDIREGIPGIPTNVLADRLRELEAAGVAARENTLFRLTPWGEQLESAVYQLGLWGARLLEKAPKSDQFRMHWLALPARAHLRDHTPHQPPISIEARSGDQAISIETRDRAVHIRPGPSENPDAVITGTPQLIAGLLFGKMDLSHAAAAGLRYLGDVEALRRVQPLAFPT